MANYRSVVFVTPQHYQYDFADGYPASASNANPIDAFDGDVNTTETFAIAGETSNALLTMNYNDAVVTEYMVIENQNLINSSADYFRLRYDAQLDDAYDDDYTLVSVWGGAHASGNNVVLDSVEDIICKYNVAILATGWPRWRLQLWRSVGTFSSNPSFNFWLGEGFEFGMFMMGKSEQTEYVQMPFQTGASGVMYPQAKEMQSFGKLVKTHNLQFTMATHTERIRAQELYARAGNRPFKMIVIEPDAVGTAAHHTVFFTSPPSITQVSGNNSVGYYDISFTLGEF